MTLRVMAPRLPCAANLMPYLLEIDANGQYTNDGPLVRRLEARLGGVCVSSGTAAIALAAHVLGFDSRAFIPAFTFPATALALLSVGTTPTLCDVDDDTWTMPAESDDCLPVAAFGAPADGILVDASGGFGPCGYMSAQSLHATKPLPAGEGGVVYGPPDLLEKVRWMRNFGLRDRLCLDAVGTNAKMSEYHAAVGLAALDEYPAHAEHRRVLMQRYQANLGDTDVRFQRNDADRTAFVVRVPFAAAMARRLAAAGIETRRWYLPTLDQHPAFRTLRKADDLKVCRALAREAIGLPLHADMRASDVDRVCDAIRDALRRGVAA